MKKKSKEKRISIMGRPPIDIDWEKFDRLCELSCTQEEIAFFFKCSVDTIANKVEEVHGVTFSEYYRENSTGGRLALRRMLWRSATGTEKIKPNVSAQIFLSKQPEERGGLGFHEKVLNEHDFTGEGSFEYKMGIVHRLESRKKAEQKAKKK